MATDIAGKTVIIPRRPALAAVTVTYNSAAVLDDFLASTFAQTGDWSLIIVDNASTDATRERLARIRDDRVRIILNTDNVGFAAATNQGIRLAIASGADPILLLNNDTVFEPEIFRRLAARLVEQGVNAMSPVIVFDDVPRKIWYAGGHMDWSRGVKNIHDHSEQDFSVVASADFETEFCPACFMIFTAATFRTIGLLDEDFFVYWEDAEFCERMKAEGLKIVVTPSLTVRHKASSLTGGTSSPFFIYHYYRNRVVFLRKSAGATFRVYGIVMMSAAVLARALLGRDSWRNALRRLHGIAHGAHAALEQTPGRYSNEDLVLNP